MPPRQHAGMSLPKRFPSSPWLPLTASFAALIVLVLGGVGLLRSPRLASVPSPASSMLVRWQDGGHDWLLVGDGQGDQLNVYSALDGRLLKRVPVRRGLNDANALAQRDGRLFVVGDDGRLGELSLPQLSMVASSGR